MLIGLVISVSIFLYFNYTCNTIKYNRIYMKLSNLLGTDLKETLKKIRYKFQNRNFVPYTVDKTLLKTDFKFYVATLDAQNWYLDEESISPVTKEWMWPELEFVKNNICKD